MVFSTHGVSRCIAFEKALMSVSGPYSCGVVLGVGIPYWRPCRRGNLIFRSRKTMMGPAPCGAGPISDQLICAQCWSRVGSSPAAALISAVLRRLPFAAADGFRLRMASALIAAGLLDCV